MKRKVPQAIAFVSGLIMILAYFIPTPMFRSLQNTLSNWVSIVAAFASFLSLTSIAVIHGEKISRKEEGFGYSAVLLVSLIITTAAGVFCGADPDYRDYVILEAKADRDLVVASAAAFTQAKDTAQKEEILVRLRPTVGTLLGITRLATLASNLESIDKQAKENLAANKEAIAPRVGGRYDGKYVLTVSYYNLFQWLYDWAYSPLSSTMFSILAFYVASAAYRAFRARSIEGTLLLVAAFLVMIGRVSIGYVLNRWSPWLPFPAISEWIMSVFNSAGQRAIMIGAALGIASASLRMLLGLEQTYLGGD